MAKISDQDIVSTLIESDSEFSENGEDTLDHEQPCSGTVIERASRKVYTVPNLSQHLQPQDRLPFKKNVSTTLYGSDNVLVDVLSYGGAMYAGAKAQFQKRKAEGQILITSPEPTVDFSLILASDERATHNVSKKKKGPSPLKKRKNIKQKKGSKAVKKLPYDDDVVSLQNRTAEIINSKNIDSIGTTHINQESASPGQSKRFKKKNSKAILAPNEWLRNKLGDSATVEATRKMKDVSQSEGYSGLSVGKNGSPLKPSAKKQLKFGPNSLEETSTTISEQGPDEKPPRKKTQPAEVGFRYLIGCMFTEEYIMAHSYHGRRISPPLTSADKFGLKMIRDYCEWYVRQYGIPYAESQIKIGKVYTKYRGNVRNKINKRRNYVPKALRRPH
ncbi:uncharacterized protein LOC132198267 [Neocloeon triangulifer]|uniref:uncharacterized protein LOC132198267 n=1 Tax=Neocloeon triangulifer TaxID=2078957 RepID=UPI00286F7B82|nr:uncharacterized protein LOC132198267 [Neocloeon triangulifer]